MSDLRAASATGKAACVPFRPWKGGSDLRAVGSPLRKGGSPRLAKPCKSLPPSAFASCREMGGRMRVRPTESHANPVAPCQWEHERIDYNPKHALIPLVKGGNDSAPGRSLGAIATSTSGPPMWPCSAALPYGRWPIPPSSVRVSPFMYLKSGPQSWTTTRPISVSTSP